MSKSRLWFLAVRPVVEFVKISHLRPFIFTWQVNWSQKANNIPILSINPLHSLMYPKCLFNHCQWVEISSLKSSFLHPESFGKITIIRENFTTQYFSQMLYFQGRISVLRGHSEAPVQSNFCLAITAKCLWNFKSSWSSRHFSSTDTLFWQLR